MNGNMCKSELWVKRIKSQFKEMETTLKDNQRVVAFYKGQPVQFIGYSSPDMIILFCPNEEDTYNRVILHVSKLEITLSVLNLEHLQSYKPIGFLQEAESISWYRAIH